MGVCFCRPYALVGIPFSSSNRLDVLLSSDENRYDSSHMTAFSERLCCSSEIASWINQPFSFSHPFPGWLNGYIRLRLECSVWSSQGARLLDAIGVFKPLKCESNYWDSLFHLVLPIYPVMQDNRVAFSGWGEWTLFTLLPWTKLQGNWFILAPKKHFFWGPSTFKARWLF